MTLTSRERTFWSLVAEAWPMWLALGGLVGAAVVASVTRSAGEARVRVAGMLLQVLGVGTVAVGLSQTRRLFGRPPALSKAASWLTRLWSVFTASRGATVYGQAAVAGAVAVTGTARVRGAAGPDSPLDRRVLVLEQNYDLLQRQVDQQEVETGERIRAIRGEVHAEVRARETENRLTAGKLEEMAVGGLHLESVGVLWLWVGVIATSVPGEIAAWLSKLR